MVRFVVAGVLVPERLHRRPCLLQRHAAQLDARDLGSGVMDPLGRVARVEGDVAQGDGKVHEVEIQIVEAEV